MPSPPMVASSLKIHISRYDRGEVSLKAELLFCLPYFAAGITGREIIHFKNRSDFDVGWLGLRVRTPLYPVDGLIKNFDLPNPKTRHEFIRVWKRARRYRPRCPFAPNPRAQRTGLQAFRRLEDSGFGEFFIEFLHVRQELLARQLAGFRILRCLDDHHNFHWLLLSLVVLNSACFPLAPFAYTETLHSTHRPDFHDFYG